MSDIQQYQRFFDELAPRLETAHTLERELDAHLARRFNAFDYLRTDELGLSRIIADLLNPQGKHGQGAAFLKLLLDGCGLEGWVLPDHARHTGVKVEVEKTIKDDRRLDVCVSLGSNCLAIENKPYAGDQPNQVRDYLDWLRKCFRNHALIYLSPSGEPPSADSVEQAYLQEREDSGHFKIMPYYAEGREWEDGFDNYRGHKYTLATWLFDCRKNCDVDRLCWFLREAEAFCERRFGGHTMGNSERDTIVDFVLSDEKNRERNWSVGLELYRAWPQVAERVFWPFLRKVALAQPKENPYPDDVAVCWAYYAYSPKSCLGLYRTCWNSYSKDMTGYRKEAKITQIRLEAYREIDSWFVGVRSDNPQLIGQSEEGHVELKQEITDKLGPSGSRDAGWVWWQWVDEKYRNWSDLVPTLQRECEQRDDETNEVTTYFVEKLAAVAKVALPIIDRYEGTK